eukprot:GILJ01004996.1.p1 GENE.GILJ01004996.1~~GILJ01004996.1.p1  ORF type:complete len:570 (+),score=44.27 GILJ01004996.1:302-2011(+)
MSLPTSVGEYILTFLVGARWSQIVEWPLQRALQRVIDSESVLGTKMVMEWHPQFGPEHLSQCVLNVRPLIKDPAGLQIVEGWIKAGWHYSRCLAVPSICSTISTTISTEDFSRLFNNCPTLVDDFHMCFCRDDRLGWTTHMLRQVISNNRVDLWEICCTKIPREYYGWRVLAKHAVFPHNNLTFLKLVVDRWQPRPLTLETLVGFVVNHNNVEALAIVAPDYQDFLPFPYRSVGEILPALLARMNPVDVEIDRVVGLCDVNIYDKLIESHIEDPRFIGRLRKHMTRQLLIHQRQKNEQKFRWVLDRCTWFGRHSRGMTSQVFSVDEAYHTPDNVATNRMFTALRQNDRQTITELMSSPAFESTPDRQRVVKIAFKTSHHRHLPQWITSRWQIFPSSLTHMANVCWNRLRRDIPVQQFESMFEYLIELHRYHFHNQQCNLLCRIGKYYMMEDVDVGCFQKFVQWRMQFPMCDQQVSEFRQVALMIGDLDTVADLHHRYGLKVTWPDFSLAARHGHVHVLDWIVKSGNMSQDDWSEVLKFHRRSPVNQLHPLQVRWFNKQQIIGNQVLLRF